MSKEAVIPHYQVRNGPQEECGVTAILGKKGSSVTHRIPEMQKKLRNRGRDAVGMAAFQRLGVLVVYKGLGEADIVFPQNFDYAARNLLSNRGIGHNRYATSGEEDKDDAEGAQPMVVSWNGRQVAISYNGNIPKSEREKLRRKIPDALRGASNYDTVDIANAIVSAQGHTWQDRIKNGMEGIRLAYALTILTDEGDVFGLRCPAGTWPLWVGENADTIIFASEDRVNKSPDMRWWPVKAGELVKATPRGVERTQLFPAEELSRCSLHDAYGARFDSRFTERIMYGQFRYELGRELALEHPIVADLYIGVPETGLKIVEGYTAQLGEIPSDFLKANGHIKSFIAKNNDEIHAIIDGKYAVVDTHAIQGKRVVLVEDSIIRGNTLGGNREKRVKGVIQMIREAGAIKVHVAAVLPKFVEGCDQGYYIQRDQLVAVVNNSDGTVSYLSEEEIARVIGADSIAYLSVRGVKNVYEKTFGKRDVACMACMGEPHPLSQLSSRGSGSFSKEPVLVFNASSKE